ncbi:MAG TPA: apolipoprotein N-acyltransferase [Verrucomicrobiae bacterium]|nr:apolipoprotein N-acyltransferase [Verrucomicrobiae bacterium]
MKFLSSQTLLRSRYFLAALAGLVFAAAFPNFNIAGLAWIGPALILASAYGTKGWETFRIGYVAGFTHFLATLYWLLYMPVKGFPILGWVAMSAFLALYPATWVWLLTGRIGEGGWLRRTAWTLGGAAAWVAMEMIRARFLSGFPWNTVGASQWQMLPLIQIAASTGIYGVSFVVVWASLAMYSGVLAMFRQPTSRYVWLSEIFPPLVVVLILFVTGTSRVRNAPAGSETLRVTFVQPAIPQTMIWDTSANSNRFDQLIELTTQALTNESDLLLWPEAALPQLDRPSFSVISKLIQTNQVWMLFGADDKEEKVKPTPEDRYNYYNAAFLLRPDGTFAGKYRKRQLVMFGEYIPLVDALPFIKWFTPITGGFTPGKRATHFELDRWGGRTREPGFPPDSTNGSPVVSRHRPIKTAALICFEDTFGHLAREYVDDDTDFLVNLTNNGWFGNSAAQWQHAASAAFRAVENGVPLLRCSNNGLTCWIDSRGRLRELFRDQTGSEYGVGFVTWQIPLLAPEQKSGRTFYNRHGDWFGWICVVATAGLLLPRVIRRKR